MRWLHKKLFRSRNASFKLLRHLGIEKAHAAAYLPGDWSGLLERHPSAVASLTLICPRGMKTEVVRPHAGRLLIVSGDGGNTVADLMRAVHDLPGATVTMLRDYFSPMWADVMADRTGEVTAAMIQKGTHRRSFSRFGKRRVRFRPCGSRRERARRPASLTP